MSQMLKRRFEPEAGPVRVLGRGLRAQRGVHLTLRAVRALLDGGANPRKPNKAGSTPLHLAVQPTGASGSGSDTARQQQAEIISLLLERGARPTDKDARGKQVYQAATSERIRTLLKEGKAG